MFTKADQETEISSLRQRVAELEQQLAPGPRLTWQPPDSAGIPASLRALNLLDSISDAVFAFDREWRFTYVNRRAETMARMAYQKLIGHVLWELFPGLAEGVVWKHCQRALSEQVHTRFEYHYAPNDLFVEANCHPTSDGVAVFVRDITGQRRLAAARLHLAAIVDSSEDAIVGKDLNGIINSWNKGAERLFGYSAEEALGRPVTLLAAPDRVNEMPEMLNRIRRGERIEHYETIRRRKNGELLAVSLTVSPVLGPSGEIIGAAKIARDVTASKAAELRARDSEERSRRQLAELELIYRSAPVGLLFVDTDLRYVRLNERMAALNGLPVEAHLGRTIAEVVPEIASIVIPHYRRVIESGQSLEEMEISGATPASSNAARTFRVSYHPVFDNSGKVMGVTAMVDDVTERKAMEEQLRQNEAQQRLVIDGMPGLVSYIDGEFRYRFANKQYLQWMEMEPQQMVGRSISELFGDHTFSLVREYAERALRGEQVSFERLLPYKDRTRYIHGTYMPDRAPDGTIRGYVALVSDISEQQRTLQELRTREEQYRFLANALPQFVWTADREGKTDFLNDYWYEYTGGSREEGIQAWARVVPTEDANCVREAWRYAFARKESFEIEHRIRRLSDGELRWHLARLRPLLDESGEVVRWIGTAIDIHDRKMVELQLSKARRDLSDILESISESFIAVDRDWRFVYVNARVAEKLKMRREDLIGRNMWEVSPESVNTPFYPNYHRVMNERVPVHFEMPFPPDRWFDVYAHPTETGMSAYVVDKTEVKRTEEALRHKAKLESLGLIAGGVAHDFNNLLVGVLGAGSMVQEMLDPASPEGELIRVITDSAERAAHLTHQMLAYAGKSRAEKEAVQLNRVILDTLQLLRATVRPSIKVVTDLSETLPPFNANPGQIQQVVLNLLTNAVEAFPPDAQGIISIATRVRHMAEPVIFGIDELTPGDYLMLEVRDSGSGMSPETRDRIFDPFFTTKFTGRGLGLAAVQGIVRSHHGAIEVESAPGEGTVFRIVFGLETAVSPKNPRRDRKVRGGGTVLVIDDEPVVLSTCKTALEHFGFAALTATDGTRGIELFRQHPGKLDAIIVDVSMPDQSGFEVIRTLAGELEGATVIISSGHGKEDLQRELDQFPSAQFVQKPYRVQDLLKWIKS